MKFTQAVLLITSFLAAISDVRTGRIPNLLTYSITALLLGIALLEQGLVVALWGILATAAPLLLLYLLSWGRGIGLGDVKLAVCIGAALGVMSGLTAISIAFMIGACVGIVGLLTGLVQRGSRIAFAPFLALGVCCACLMPGAGWYA